MRKQLADSVARRASLKISRVSAAALVLFPAALCSTHPPPATPQARYANYEATASEKDSVAARAPFASLPNWILYFEL